MCWLRTGERWLMPSTSPQKNRFGRLSSVNSGRRRFEAARYGIGLTTFSAYSRFARSLSISLGRVLVLGVVAVPANSQPQERETKRMVPTLTGRRAGK